MEEDVNIRKEDRYEKNYEEKEAECLNETSSVEMEKVVKDINDDKN